MEEIGLLMQGFAVALQPENLLLMLVGVTLGVLIGVLPGLGGANGIAILLPLTFAMPPVSAIIMLSCIYWGALFGGAQIVEMVRSTSDSSGCSCPVSRARICWEVGRLRGSLSKAATTSSDRPWSRP